MFKCPTKEHVLSLVWDLARNVFKYGWQFESFNEDWVVTFC